jgi:hypothetical protein
VKLYFQAYVNETAPFGSSVEVMVVGMAYPDI